MLRTKKLLLHPCSTVPRWSCSYVLFVSIVFIALQLECQYPQVKKTGSLHGVRIVAEHLGHDEEKHGVCTVSQSHVRDAESVNE